MATLDEKFLDGPNVGYCSDSDEDIEANNSFQPCENRSTNSQQRSGVNTGPKGVLADYRQHLKECANERQKAELNVIKLKNLTSLLI